MNIESCYQLGHVIKKHGLKGEVSILLDVDYPDDYATLESVFLEQGGKLIPFFIESIHINGGKAIVKFEDVDDALGAEGLRGAKMYLPLDQLPDLGEGQFYFHEVIGYTVMDGLRGKVGEIKDIYSFPNQDLMAVDYQGKEVLVPVNDDIILSVDHDSHQMNVTLPEGLLEIYLD